MGQHSDSANAVAINARIRRINNMAELHELIAKIEEGNDFVIGSRFIEKEGFQSTFIRRMGINLYSWIIKLFTNKEIKDTTSGYRAANKKKAYTSKNEFVITQKILLNFLSLMGSINLSLPVAIKNSVKSRGYNFINSTFPTGNPVPS